jgi:hypothetical protein
MWGALSDERTGLSFTIAAGPRQCSHSRVRVPRDSRPYFIVSDSRLFFSSPPTTRSATVEVLEPSSTRDSTCYLSVSDWTNLMRTKYRSSVPFCCSCLLCAGYHVLISKQPFRSSMSTPCYLVKTRMLLYVVTCTGTLLSNGRLVLAPLFRLFSRHVTTLRKFVIQSVT